SSSGVTYIMTRGFGTTNTKLWTLPPNLSGEPQPVPGFSTVKPTEGTQFFGASGEGRLTFGPQLAISPDASTLYSNHRVEFSNNFLEPSSYLVRAYSLADKLTSTVYGGGEEELECRIQSPQAAFVAAGPDLYVLDQGSESPELESWGNHVLRFGPGGSDC